MSVLIRSLYKTSPFLRPYSLIHILYKSQHVSTFHSQISSTKRQSVPMLLVFQPEQAKLFSPPESKQPDVLISIRVFFGSFIPMVSLLIVLQTNTTFPCSLALSPLDLSPSLPAPRMSIVLKQTFF